MKIFRLIAACLLPAAILLTACTAAQGSGNGTVEPTRPQETPPENIGSSDACLMAPDITGIVLEVKEDGRVILVDSDADVVKGQIWVTITDDTSFFEDVPADSSIGISDVSRDFQVGNTVAILSDGNIMESYPMQARASAVYENSAP